MRALEFASWHVLYNNLFVLQLTIIQCDQSANGVPSTGSQNVFSYLHSSTSSTSSTPPKFNIAWRLEDDPASYWVKRSLFRGKTHC